MPFSGVRVVGKSSFRSLWKQLAPFIVTAKPMSDLCWTCQRNITLVYRSANQTEAEKSERLKGQEEHLRLAELQREVYRGMVKDSQELLEVSGVKELGKSRPCVLSGSVHYSFDYAQQVHLPSNPLQPGPIYFLAPRKVGIFGVCCEGLPRQVNYLIDEAHMVSKGSNAVVSYLHHFFDTYGLGETDATLHCDNCAGQNKNNFVLWYCAWRVAVGLHKSISLNFLIPGHTKFAPDCFFGLLKQAFRRQAVSTLDELERVVEDSAVSNKAQSVGTQAGEVLVPVGNWQNHFGPFFKPIQGIKKIHQFRYFLLIFWQS